MKILGVIPARYDSSRFPGKPLVDIAGKSMIQRVYEQSKKCKELLEVFVATDDDKIFAHVKEFGGNVKLTSDHNSGTERCNELAQNLKEKFNIVINIQGDEPCINPEQISQVVNCFTDDHTNIATLAKQIKTTENLLNENIVKVVFGANNFAQDFNRLPIPEPKSFDSEKWFLNNKFYKHIGIYAYRTEILQEICKLKQSEREIKEKLEQLRWLENGYKIKVGITEFESQSVDVPKDIEKLNL
jgi:3-deoxy-manno-octulosonate cytidylyltransferase (CMP-KDO synthetase)|tara:strand:- start:697 stop:1425 length:729 start_codon:yes stop_codon:yes gene_type:complete